MTHRIHYREQMTHALSTSASEWLQPILTTASESPHPPVNDIPRKNLYNGPDLVLLIKVVF